jgi:protein-tyrosine phosphatase
MSPYGNETQYPFPHQDALYPAPFCPQGIDLRAGRGCGSIGHARMPESRPKDLPLPHLVLFLCTGNYYRSRYAEELFNHLAKLEGLAWRAVSRGAVERQFAENVGSISPYAHEALEKKSIVPEGASRALQPCSMKDIGLAQIVIALSEAEHRPMIEERFPDVTRRIRYWQVDDIELVQPSIALAKIDDHVRELISSLRVAS